MSVYKQLQKSLRPRKSNYHDQPRSAHRNLPFFLFQFRIADSSANSNANLQDYLDIVATQGAYLVPRAGTPVCPEAYNDQLVAALKQHLNAVITEQICRRVMYHGAADEWPIGRTPPKVTKRRKAELKAPLRPPQVDWLPTPPLSAESPLAIPYRRKWRRIPEEDDEEKERRATKHASPVQKASTAAAKDAMPSTA
ncbi:hypothetical protein SCUP515_10242 [Seiridium cupressi]